MVNLFDGVGTKLRGAEDSVTGNIADVVGDFAGVSRRLFRRLRRVLIVSSVKICATARVYSLLHGGVGRRNVASPTIVGNLVGRVVTRVLNRSRNLGLGAAPSVVLIVNMGNINGAAAVNGLTLSLGSRNGEIILNTTSAFHTTTVSRLNV